MKQKPTEDQMNEALNPDLSNDFITVGDRQVQIKIMALETEQVFLKTIKGAIGDKVDLSGMKVIDIVNIVCELPAEKLRSLVELIMLNSGEEVDQDWLKTNTTYVVVADMVTAQMEKQRYLDFLFKTMSKFKAGKALLMSLITR